MNTYEIELQQVAVGYHGKKLIENINFKVHAGEILTLIGPNGAGKSTILKSITKQLSCIEGTIYLEKENMTKMSENQIAKVMSMVSTQRLRTELTTCKEIVETGRYPYTGRLGILSEKDHEKVNEVMEKFRVMHIKDKDFMEISDGQRQRVMLARALCQEPKVLILDEPTSFLDIRYKVEILSMIRKMAKEENIAIVMSLHELDFARRISDKIVCVNGDHIEKIGSTTEIFESNLIPTLFGMDEDCYDTITGQVELQAQKGNPEVFVIGGGGAGITIYHELQRKGIPFAVGVLHENDVEYATAKALASKVIAEKAFEPISEEHYEQSLTIMKECKQVICAVQMFGLCNQKNKELLSAAEGLGYIKTDDIDEK